MKLRAERPTKDNCTNFDIVSASTTKVGTTLENLKAAVEGETGASARYAAFSKAAEDQGYAQIARLFAATSFAEQVHIGLESNLILKEEPDYVKPSAPEAQAEASDLNLIAGAQGEIYETSDMYPSFVKKAAEEGKDEAVRVFSRAKLAESVHAELYLQAYNDIDAADDDAFYVCPFCGYIHKGDDFEKCPICFAPKDKFKKF
ncbi:MAG: nigerythrin [Eggerthellaceae bacterium]|jgi:rubrerythrin